MGAPWGTVVPQVGAIGTLGDRWQVLDQDGYLTADEGIFVRLLPFSKQNMVFFIVLSTKLFNDFFGLLLTL